MIQICLLMGFMLISRRIPLCIATELEKKEIKTLMFKQYVINITIRNVEYLEGME